MIWVIRTLVFQSAFLGAPRWSQKVGLVGHLHPSPNALFPNLMTWTLCSLGKKLANRWSLYQLYKEIFLRRLLIESVLQWDILIDLKIQIVQNSFRSTYHKLIYWLICEMWPLMGKTVWPVEVLVNLWKNVCLWKRFLLFISFLPLAASFWLPSLLLQ